MTLGEQLEATGVDKAINVRAEGNTVVNALTAIKIARAASITPERLLTEELGPNGGKQSET